jgi:uncharacterized protein YraI
MNKSSSCRFANQFLAALVLTAGLAGPLAASAALGARDVAIRSGPGTSGGVVVTTGFAHVGDPPGARTPEKRRR